MVLRLVRVDENAQVCKAILPEGTSYIGRGPLLDCADKRVSRKHGELFVMDECIYIKSLHAKNPCFIKKQHSNDLIVVNFEERFPLNNGDRIGFLPDNYWYEIIVSQNMTETQQCKVNQAESVALNRTKTEPLDFDETTQAQAINAPSTSNNNAYYSDTEQESSRKRPHDSQTPAGAKVIKKEPITPSKDGPSSGELHNRISDPLDVPELPSMDTERPSNETEAPENDTNSDTNHSNNDDTFCNIGITNVKTEPVEEVGTSMNQVPSPVIKNAPSPSSPPRASSPQQPSPTLQLPSPQQNNTAVRARCRYGVSCYRSESARLPLPLKSSPSLPLLPSSSASTEAASPTIKQVSSSPTIKQVSSSPTSSRVPSPATFLERGDSESTSSSSSTSQVQHLTPRRRPRRLRPDNMSSLVNHGSDEDSDESNDEDGEIVAPTIPRVFRSFMETPLDNDVDNATDEHATADSAPAAGSGATDPLELGVPETTGQPRNSLRFDWREFPDPPIPPESRRETFSAINVGPTTPCADPYSIFIEIWDRQIMEHIVLETNTYAQQVASQMLDNHDLHPTSRISKWYDTTVDELYVYFGLMLAMGIVVKSRIDEYWGATSDIFCTPGFRAHMSIDRFLILNKCLHFNDNNKMCALDLDHTEARLFKIKPILLHLNEKFQSMYTPAQNIALDESLLMWKGCLEFCQIIPNKAANRGIKTYEICESRTGYLWRFEIHAHKKSDYVRHSEDPLEAPTPAIVLQLVRGLEHKGYTLWMDSYYQSPCLARRLKSLGFDCVGTLRTDRKFVPRELNELTKRNMQPGHIAGLTSGDVDVMVWRNTNRVAMISTYHGNAKQTTRDATKPILIMDYNIMMGGVDKKDQMLAMYPVERKRSKVWYKKLFRRLLNVSVLNAYIIHHHSSAISHRNFRISLVKSLLSRHSSPSSIPASQKKADVTHRLSELPMGKHQRMRRACTVCKKQVRTFCVGCDKTVCMDPCFLSLH